jgi:hypothetical protein
VSFAPWGITGAPVTCLDVRDDNVLVLGGVAPRTPFVPEPVIFMLYVADHGTPVPGTGFGADIFTGYHFPSRGSVADVTACRAAMFHGLPGQAFLPIASGDITIRIHGRIRDNG